MNLRNTAAEHRTSMNDSCQAMLANFLTDESLCNIVLLGNDGVQVKTNSYLLASRSKVFRKTFLGSFSESKSSTIPYQQFSGEVLRLVVEFMITDSVSVLAPFQLKDCNIIHRDENTKKRKLDEMHSMGSFEKLERMRTVISLFGAADYFDLSALTSRTLQVLASYLKRDKSASLILLQACYEEDVAYDSNFRGQAAYKVAWSNIQSMEFMDFLDLREVPLLCPLLLEQIISDQTMQVKEYELFRVLQIWVKGNGQLTGSEEREGQDIGMQLMKHINLELIEPKKLNDLVAPSGLASLQQLCEAHKKQAMLVQEKGSNISLDRHRHIRQKWIGVNFGSADNCYLISCVNLPLKFGTLKWRFEILQSDSFELGVAAIDRRKLKIRWAYCCTGQTWVKSGANLSKELKKKPPFSNGQEVAFTLHLLPDTKEFGTVSAVINNGDCYELFRGLQLSPLRCMSFAPFLFFENKETNISTYVNLLSIELFDQEKRQLFNLRKKKST